MSNVQLRGNCPMCGRQQAVKKGYMSKHGYTVEHGWFNGVCPGQNYAPLQHDRIKPKVEWDDIVRTCAKLEDDALKYEQGELVPDSMPVKKPIPGTNAWSKERYQTIYVPWAEVKDYDKSSYIRTLVWNMRARAKGGRQFVEDITKLADQVHGQPLVEVVTRSGPVYHAKDPRPNYGNKYTLCGQRISAQFGNRYLTTTDKAEHVSCAKCIAEAAKEK